METRGGPISVFVFSSSLLWLTVVWVSTDSIVQLCGRIEVINLLNEIQPVVDQLELITTYSDAITSTGC
jgi:hypothetical protein